MKKITVLIFTILFVASNLYAQEKIGSKIYFDYTYNSDGKPTNGFEIHRVYFTYQNHISKNISYKFTTDVGRFNTGKDNRLSVYLKNALVKWKTSVGSLVFGLQGLNTFSVQEHNWGYRFVEKSPMDLYHFASSADLGLGYYNKLSGKVNFSAIISNGTGYKKSENDNYKKISLQLFYGDSKIKKDGNFNVGAIFTTESFDYVAGTDTTTKTKTVFGGFAVYRISGLRIGAEYDIFKTGGIDVTKNIFSVYANFAAAKNLDLFARFDTFDPNIDKNNDGNTYIVVGLNYKPAKGLYIAPNVRITNPELGDATTIYKLSFQFKI